MSSSRKQQRAQVAAAFGEATKRAKPSPLSAAASITIDGQHLPAGLLVLIGQFLDVESRVAAIATNHALQLAMSSDAAWRDSRWVVSYNTLHSKVSTCNPASLQQLWHFRFGLDALRTSPDIKAAQAFLQRLGPLPALRSLHNIYDPTVEDLQD